MSGGSIGAVVGAPYTGPSQLVFGCVTDIVFLYL